MVLTDRPTGVLTDEPVEIADVKVSARIDADLHEFDALIARLISQAREVAEHETGRCLAQRTWRVELDGWPDRVDLAGAPVQSLTAVQYWDGTEWQTLPTGAFRLLEMADRRASIVRSAAATLPPLPADVGPRVRLDYLAGFDPVPEAARGWIIAQCVHWLEHPEAATERTLSPSPFLAGLLDPIRTWT